MAATGMRRYWGIAETIGELCPGAQWSITDNDYTKLQWFSTDQQPPTLEAIQAKQAELEAAEPMRVVREIRDWYLQQSDWTQGADIRNIRGSDWCASWDKYRQDLRNLPDSGITPSFDQMNFIQGVTWPEMPNTK